jgi:hypothetical protein
MKWAKTERFDVGNGSPPRVMRAPQAILVVFGNEPAAIKLAPLIRGL